MEIYAIPILFKEGDIIYNPENRHYKKYVIKFDENKGEYLCDGYTVKLLDSFNWKKVETPSDLFIGDYCRLQGNPDCFEIVEFLEDNKVKIAQIHGDNYYKIVDLLELLDRGGHYYFKR